MRCAAFARRALRGDATPHQGRGKCSFACGAVDDAIARVFAFVPARIELDELELALQLDDVRALARRDVDEERTIAHAGVRRERAQLPLHRLFARDEELGLAAVAEI